MLFNLCTIQKKRLNSKGTKYMCFTRNSRKGDIKHED